MTHIRLMLIVAGITLTCNGCSTTSAEKGRLGLESALHSANPTPGYWLGLPNPSSLDLPSRPRQSRFTESDLIRSGADTSPQLPLQRATPQGPDLLCDPDRLADSSGLERLSIAGYVFSAPGYDRQPLLQCSWGDPAIAAADIWLGLANWDENRWDWFRCGGEYRTLLTSLEPYFSFGGDLAMILLCTGKDPGVLNSVRIGTTLPQAKLQAAPYLGAPPFSTTLDASLSTATEGVLSYEFDTGDGSFVDNGTNPLFPVQYTDAGKYLARVRVSDEQGGQDIAETNIYAAGAWSHTWSRSQYDEIYSIAGNTQGEFYACGTSSSPSLLSQATVWKFNALGEILWVRAFDSLTHVIFYCCAVDADGNLILGGRDQGISGNVSGIVQKWNPEGEIIWSKTMIMGSRYPHIAQVLLDYREIYLVGTSFGLTSDVLGNAVLMRINSSGELVWARSWTADGEKQADSLSGGTLRFDFQSGLEGIMAAGYTGLQDSSIPTWQPSPLLLEFDPSGNVIRSWRLGGENLQSTFTDVRISGSIPNQRIIAMGQAIGESQFIVRSDFSGLTDWSGSLVLPGLQIKPSEMSLTAAGIVAIGNWDAGDTDKGLLTCLDPVSDSVVFQRQWPAGGYGYFEALCKAADGAFMIGGSSFSTSGEFSDMGAGFVTFGFNFETVSGTSSQPFLFYEADNQETVVLEGQLDVIEGGRAALIMRVLP